jgi:hypothetical protein
MKNAAPTAKRFHHYSRIFNYQLDLHSYLASTLASCASQNNNHKRPFEARLNHRQKDEESTMPTLSVHCYKGVNSSDMGVYNFDPQMNLADVRSALTSSGFVAPDTDDVALRFVASQSKSTNLEDALIAKSVENIVPLQGVLGAHNQLILTNIVARKNRI